MNLPLDQPVRPYALYAALWGGPDEVTKSDFFTTASRSYLFGVATFLHEGSGCPPCTPGNVAAMVQYPDHQQVIRRLATEPAAACIVKPFIVALEQTAEQQVAGIVSTLKIGLPLAGLVPDEQAMRTIRQYMEQTPGGGREEMA